MPGLLGVIDINGNKIGPICSYINEEGTHKEIKAGRGFLY